jgi:hypothetical protein
MKNLNKLQINSEKLMKNEELMTLRGGYDSVFCSCRIGGSTCWSGQAENCGSEYGSCYQYCSYYCPNFDSLICVGG